MKKWDNIIIPNQKNEYEYEWFLKGGLFSFITTGPRFWIPETEHLMEHFGTFTLEEIRTDEIKSDILKNADFLKRNNTTNNEFIYYKQTKESRDLGKYKTFLKYIDCISIGEHLNNVKSMNHPCSNHENKRFKDGTFKVITLAYKNFFNTPREEIFEWIQTFSTHGVVIEKHFEKGYWLGLDVKQLIKCYNEDKYGTS